MTGVWVFLVRVFEIVAARTEVGLALVVVVGGTLAVKIDNAGLFFLAWIAFLSLVWLLDSRRWERS